MIDLTRADLAVICAELGAAFSRIATRLSLSTSTSVQIVQPSPEPAAAPAAAPKAPAPATPQRQEAAAGPKQPTIERVAAALRQMGSATRGQLDDLLPGMQSEWLRVCLRRLAEEGRARSTGATSATIWHWVGEEAPEQAPEPAEEPAAREPSEPQETPAEPTAAEPPQTTVVALTARAKPAPGPTLRKQLLDLAQGGPFTIGRAVTHTGKPTQQCYNLLGQLARDGLIVRSDYAPRTYALPGQLPSVPPAEPHDTRAAAEPGKRKCLRCNKSFHSEGAHNRLCGNCSSTVGGMAIQ